VLTRHQIEQYHLVGYTVSPGFLDPAEVRELGTEIDRISAGCTLREHDRGRMEMEPDQPPEGTLVRRIYEPCTYYAPFRALSESADMLDAVEGLLGPDLDFHYSKINMKAPSIGSVVDWHQDLSYYPLTHPGSVSILTYLDGASRENGCLRVIPGRHLGPPLDHTRDGYFQGRITEPVDESHAVPLEGAAGTVIFMHSLTPHASGANRSTRPRRTLILSYRATDAFPIYVREMTMSAESHVRHVRGRQLQTARFGFQVFPIPRYPRKTASLYELQDLSRKAEGVPLPAGQKMKRN
jgi:hypothetical protein